MIKVIIIDCFGVIYRDAFKEFLTTNEVKLIKYLNQNSLGKELGFPTYYYDLAHKIDMKKVSDEDFYTIFSEASGEDPEEIRKQMNAVDVMLKEEVIAFLKKIKSQYKLVLVANADRKFLQKFLDHKPFLSQGRISELFDMPITSSDTGVLKTHALTFKKIADTFQVKKEDMLYIDDSAQHIKEVSSMEINTIHFQNIEQLKSDFQTFERPNISPALSP